MTLKMNFYNSLGGCIMSAGGRCMLMSVILEWTGVLAHQEPRMRWCVGQHMLGSRTFNPAST